MSNEYLKKFAEELKKQRDESKLSISQISTKTRIDKKYLIAIEEGNFTIMPDVYIRAFIKEYASTIGLNPTEVLSKYEMVQKGLSSDIEQETKKKNVDDSIETTIPAEEEISDSTTLDSNSEIPLKHSNSKKSLYYSLTGVLLLILIYLIYNVLFIDDNNQIITEKPFEEIIQSQETDSKSLRQAEPSEENKINLKETEKITPKIKESVSVKSEITNQNVVSNIVDQFPKTPLVLQIIGSDKSWIRVVTDEKDNTEFIIEQDITKVMGAQNKFYLHIGNSNGVKLILNNKELNFTGAPGKVRKIFVTKDGIEYLGRTPEDNAEGQL